MDIPRISQPIPIEPKRKYTINIDSDNAEYRGDLDTAFYSTTNPPDFRNYSLDNYYKIPVPLESKSGFFNVSVKSFDIQTRYNKEIPNPVPVAPIFDEATYPIFTGNNISINLEATSPYAINLEANRATETATNYNINTYYSLLKIGNVNITNSNVGGSSMYPAPIPNIAPGPGANTAVTGSYNFPQSYICSMDDYSTTIVNTSPQLIHIVLGSNNYDLDNNIVRNSASCYQLPLIANDNRQTYPFYFRYNLVLQFEEV